MAGGRLIDWRPARSAGCVQRCRNPRGGQNTRPCCGAARLPSTFAAGEIVAIYGTNLCGTGTSAVPTFPNRPPGVTSSITRRNGEARDYHGGSAIAWSTDKGKTWSDPVSVHPDHSPKLYAPTVKPMLEQASPWDRPILWRTRPPARSTLREADRPIRSTRRRRQKIDASLTGKRRFHRFGP